MNAPKLFSILILSSAIVTATLAVAPPAAAQTKVRFAYIKTTSLLPIFHAQSKGYYKNEGIDLELIPVQSGPAASAAIASDSADIGFSAVTPVVIAREQGLPYRFFIAMESEQAPSNVRWGRLYASERSGIKSFKEVVGKTVLVGPPGGLCELAWRDWLGKNGVSYGEIKVLFNPFPQHQAMLEVGTADAACTVEPFFTSIQNSKVAPRMLGEGFLADERQRYVLDGLFADEKWIRNNQAAVATLKRVTSKAAKELMEDPAALRKALIEDFRFPPALTERIKLTFPTDYSAKMSEFEVIVSAMKRNGMIKTNLSADSVVADVK